MRCIICGKKRGKYRKKYCAECAKKVIQLQKESYRKKKYCVVCGNEVLIKEHYKFCSDECAEKFAKIHNRKKSLMRYHRDQAIWRSYGKKKQLKLMQDYMIKGLL